MSKQWGHGYHKGIDAAQNNSGTLAGLWFHSFKNGEIMWQGQVVRALENNSYVVQLYEWFMGEPSVQKVIPFEQMKEWSFYPTDRDMRRAWDKDERKRIRQPGENQ